MADVFLSYSREDKSRVEPIVHFLQGQGFSVFWDSEVLPGSTWRQVLTHELNAARCVVVAWSSHSVISEWVLDEAESGKKTKRLIPVLLERLDPPLGFQSIQALGPILQGEAPDQPALASLAAAIRKRVGTEPVGGSIPAVGTSVVPRKGIKNRDRLYAGAAALSAAVAGLLSVLPWSGEESPEPAITPGARSLTSPSPTTRIPKDDLTALLDESARHDSSVPRYRRVYFETFDSTNDLAEGVWLVGKRGDWFGRIEGNEYRLCNRANSAAASYTSSMRYSEEGKTVEQSSSRVKMKVRLLAPARKYAAAGIMFRHSAETDSYQALALTAGHSLMHVSARGNQVKIVSTWTLDGPEDGDQVELATEEIGNSIKLLVGGKLVDTIEVASSGVAGVFAMGQGCFQFDDVSMELPSSPQTAL